MALLHALLDTPEQTDVTNHHAQDEQRWLSLVQQAFDNHEGRAYLARPQGIRQSKDRLQARGGRDILHVLQGNLGRFPDIGTELVNFLREHLEIWLLLMEQSLEGCRGDAVAALGDGMGYPVAQLWTFKTLTFDAYRTLPEARRALFRIIDTAAAN
jgi:hypothetical protein